MFLCSAVFVGSGSPRQAAQAKQQLRESLRALGSPSWTLGPAPWEKQGSVASQPSAELTANDSPGRDEEAQQNLMHPHYQLCLPSCSRAPLPPGARVLN